MPRPEQIAPPRAAPTILRRVLPGWVEPAVAFRALAAQHPHLVWHDRSRAPTDRVGFIGVAATDDDLLVLPAAPREDALERLAADLRRGMPDHPLPSGLLGWWGWLGYELGGAALGLADPATAADTDPPPSAALLLARTGAEFDHDARTVTVVAMPGGEDAADGLAALLRPLQGRPEPAPGTPAPAPWSWRHGRDDYLRLIERCRRSIAAGDAYQLCLTNRVTARLPAHLDPLDVHLRLRGTAPVQGGGVLRIAGWSLVSASPETFVAIDASGVARSRPIKGTRPRGADPAADALLVDELRSSEKERAENLMIVDLVRNDLARVSRVGSVEVTGLFEVETFPALHQLVSTVVSRTDGDPLDAVRSLFPAGSMTGAPKRSAMRILQGLEQGPRGVYAGAAGRISVDGTVDLSVVIRSILLHGDEAVIGTGGGITILSAPEEEWAEIELKVRPLLRALGA